MPIYPNQWKIHSYCIDLKALNDEYEERQQGIGYQCIEPTGLNRQSW